jgi:hypothetical protein
MLTGQLRIKWEPELRQLESLVHENVAVLDFCESRQVEDLWVLFRGCRDGRMARQHERVLNRTRPALLPQVTVDRKVEVSPPFVTW